MLGRHIRNIIKESLDDLNWMGSSELNFDPKHKFNGNIKQITSVYDVPMSFDDGIGPSTINMYLNHWGPMYIFELDGMKYLYQDRGSFEMFIDEEGFDYVDNEILEKLGVADMGLRFSDILDIYFDENKDLNESLDDLDWIRSSESGFDPNFEFKNFEYWVDLSTLTSTEIKVVGDYILKVLSNINLSGDRARKFSNLRSYKGIIIHCGSDTTDYEPEKNNLCFMDIPFEEDENIEHSIYIDGREVLGYIKSTEEDEELDESLNWSDNDTTSWSTDKNFSTDPTFIADPNWASSPEKSYWVQGSTGGSSESGGDVNESDEDWSWLEDTGEHPSYNGHPQGVVYLRDHDEIDEFCDIIKNYNGGELPRGGARENLHRGLEDSRDELEYSDYDPSDAVLSASFFVERKIPGILSVGYWGYSVEHYDITEWLDHEDTFNKEYHLYTNLNQVREIFKDYQNPELIKESDFDINWIKEIYPAPTWGELIKMDREYGFLKSGDIIKLRGELTHGIDSVRPRYFDDVIIRFVKYEYKSPVVNHVGPEEVNEWLGIDDTEDEFYMTGNDENSMVVINFEELTKGKTLKESKEEDSDWDWIKDVPNPVPFEMVELGKKYKIEVTEDLRDALESCSDNLRMFVEGYYGVATQSDEIPYNQIHCYTEIEDKVFTLQLYFYDIDDNEISYFWVTSNMVNFYEM